MTGVVSGDFELTMAQLRSVARYVHDVARPLLGLCEAAADDDPRPRAALEAARVFAEGAPRSRLQRTTSIEAHRAAASAPDEVARLAAQAAGDAASAAYLHPIRRAHQVGHILRASANAVRIAELRADGDAGVASAALAAMVERTPPEVIEVLRLYPPAPRGSSRTAVLMVELDAALRSSTRSVER